jgi:hypothetical protein
VTRYFTRPRAAPDGDFDDPMLPPLSVSEHVPVDTGLVDKRGDRIMRAPNRVGFHHPRERG